MEVLSILSKYKMPSEFIFTFSVNKFNEFKSLLDSKTGVYILNDKHGNPLYVGYSINLKERIYCHLAGITNTKEYFERFCDVTIVFSKNVTAARISEMILIKELKGILNKEIIDARWIERFDNIINQKDDLINENSWQKEEASYLHNNVEALIKKKGFKKSFVAKEIGVSKTTLSLWMNNKEDKSKTSPNVHLVLRLAKLLECEVEDLFEVREL